MLGSTFGRSKVAKNRDISYIYHILDNQMCTLPPCEEGKFICKVISLFFLDFREGSEQELTSLAGEVDSRKGDGVLKVNWTLPKVDPVL